MLALAFEQASIPYAIGGALAYGMWGIPRATLDVDVNVFVDDAELRKVTDALASVGIPTQLEQVARDCAARGMFSAKFGAYRVDVFVPSIPFSAEAERTRVQVDIDGHRVWFLSAEALSVFKLLFFRPKDVVDLERLLEVQGDKLDRAYVRRELVAMMGEGDPRVQRWDELVRNTQ